MGNLQDFQMTFTFNGMAIYYIAVLQRPHIELHHANQ